MSWKPRVIDGQGGRPEESAVPGPRPEPTDAELARLALAGLDLDGRSDARLPGRDAFGLLVQRHERSVLRVAWNLTGNREDARDAAQDAFMRAYRSLGSYRPEGSFRSWLVKIAVNAARDVVGRRPALLRAVEDLPDRQDPVDQEARAEAVLMLEEVRQAMASLPPREREVFVLRDLEDLDVEEIATLLAIAVPTVRRHLARARLHIRRLLASPA